jgi:hypothetical protein
MESTSSRGDDVTDGTPTEVKPGNEVLEELITFIFIDQSMFIPGVNEIVNVCSRETVTTTRIFDDIDRVTLMLEKNLEAMKSIINRDSSFRVNERIKWVLVADYSWNSDHICF